MAANSLVLVLNCHVWLQIVLFGIKLFCLVANSLVLVSNCHVWFQIVLFGCELYCLVANCLVWLQIVVCFGFNLSCLGSTCPIWVQIVLFGCKLSCLVVRPDCVNGSHEISSVFLYISISVDPSYWQYPTQGCLLRLDTLDALQWTENVVFKSMDTQEDEVFGERGVRIFSACQLSASSSADNQLRHMKTFR